MQDDKDNLTEARNNNGTLKLVDERDPTPIGECSFTGEIDCLLSHLFEVII
jgi:hypothetical protein